MSEILFLIAAIWLVTRYKGPNPDEICPHCGYYCDGKSAWCTKHPDSPGKRS